MNVLDFAEELKHLAWACGCLYLRTGRENTGETILLCGIKPYTLGKRPSVSIQGGMRADNILTQYLRTCGFRAERIWVPALRCKRWLNWKGHARRLLREEAKPLQWIWIATTADLEIGETVMPGAGMEWMEQSLSTQDSVIIL